MKILGLIRRRVRKRQIKEDRRAWEEAVDRALEEMEGADYELKAIKILYMGIFDEVVAEEDE